VARALRRWRCQICGWIYDEAKGDPASGIQPGTAWADIPDTWTCPDCGAAKIDFVMVELAPEFAATDTAIANADAAGDLVLGTDTIGFEIDASRRTINSAQTSQPYRSVIVVTGSDSPPTHGDERATLQRGELVLHDGLRAPGAIDAPQLSRWDRLKAWWWGA